MQAELRTSDAKPRSRKPKLVEPKMTIPVVSRFEARITPELHAMLRRAAQIQGRTMTDFAINALQNSANQAIEQAEVMRLCREDQIAFANALLNPPPLNAVMQKALAEHARRVTMLD